MDHQLVAASLAGLATLYCEQRKFAQAESLLRRAQRICDQLVETHPARARTLLSLAQLREAQGAHEEARHVYERLLALQEQSLGGRHPNTIETRRRLRALL